jgi:DNA-3-methyladenine glycosylase
LTDLGLDRRLSRQFFNRPTLQVAHDLLGSRLVRQQDGARLAGIITETEAYCGEEDLACHARAGRTDRTRVMYGPAGFAYIYFTYGMHWMLNFVTEGEGVPAAVLIRAIEPAEGIELIAARRSGRPARDWTNGPAKLCQALGIDGRLNGTDLTDPEGCLFVEAGPPAPENLVETGPRVGIDSVPEPWQSVPWRFVYRYLRDYRSQVEPLAEDPAEE